MGLTVGNLAMMTSAGPLIIHSSLPSRRHLYPYQFRCGARAPDNPQSLHPAKPRRNILRVMALSEETEIKYNMTWSTDKSWFLGRDTPSAEAQLFKAN